VKVAVRKDTAVGGRDIVQTQLGKPFYM